MVSRTVSAIKKENPNEILTNIPGPESLRSMMHAAKISGVSIDVVGAAVVEIDAFALMIREQYGTRSALNAALSVHHEDTRQRFEQSSRYQVYKGMNQILGVECKLWLGCCMLSPNAERIGSVTMTSVFGPVGLRRLRPDMPILLEYGRPLAYKTGGTDPVRPESIELKEFFLNPPAIMEVFEKNGQELTTFAPQIQGKDDFYDMLLCSQVAVDDYERVEKGKTRGRSVVPDVPVEMLTCDIIIHKDVLKGVKPRLNVYRTLGKGVAHIDDVSRHNDRIATAEEVVRIGPGVHDLSTQDMPRYAEMMESLCQHNGHSSSDFITYRLEVQYPIYGFQFLISFDKDDSAASSVQ